MLKIIDRYIGRQVVFSTLFAVMVLTVVLVLGNVVQLINDLMKSQIPLGAILKSIAYLMPFSLAFTIPWGLLTAILLVFGRLSADNELIALRMAGQSIPRICVPVFIIAGALSAACLWINATVAPRAEAAIKSTLFKAALDDPLKLFVADQVTETIPGYKIYVASKEGNELFGFRMVQTEGIRAQKLILAEKVTVDPSEDGSEIQLVMENAQFLTTIQESNDPAVPTIKQLLPPVEETTQVISLAELIKKSTRRRPSQMSTKDLIAASKDESEEPGERSSFRVEAQKRFSFSMACITFALIGVPLGITAQRRETSSGFVISLGVAAIYFMMIIMVDWFKQNPDAYPHLLIWLPNLIFLTIGGRLFYKLSRR